MAEIIRAFCLDALSGAVNLNVDLDVVLCVLAQALTAAFRLRLPGNYDSATPTPCNAASSTPQARSSTPTTRSSSSSTGGPTHPSFAAPTSLPPPPSPGGQAADSASTSPDHRADTAARKSALTNRQRPGGDSRQTRALADVSAISGAYLRGKRSARRNTK